MPTAKAVVAPRGIFGGEVNFIIVPTLCLNILAYIGQLLKSGVTPAR